MRRVASLAILLAVTAEAHAAVFEPKMEDVCLPVPKINAPGRFQPQLLLDQVLGAADVTFADLPGDVTTQRKIDAVLAGQEYCRTAGPGCPANDTVRQATNKKFATAQRLLQDYFQHHRDPVDPKTGGYQFSFTPTRATLKEFFGTPKSPLVPNCIAGQSAPNMAAPPVASDKSRAPGQLLVRKTVSDLSVGAAGFKNLQRASFGVTDDVLKSSRAYSIQGVVGYSFGQAPVPGWSGAYAEAIPYVGYTRQYVSGANPSNLSSVDNISPGISGDILFPALAFQDAFPLTAGMYNSVALATQLVHSNITQTNVLTGKVTYTPYISPTVVPGIATTAQFGDYLVMLTPQLVFVYADVTNAGSSAVLNKTGTYERPGAHLEFSANAVGGPLEGFGIATSYDYQKSYGIAGLNSISLFSATLSYTMPKQEYWSVQLTYNDGRNLDTLEKQQVLTLGAGLKY